jgi:DNA-binding transcriptional LysR family regulator
MTLQQLRAVCEIVARDFNVSKAAVAVHASQPAVSKMLRSLENELGAEIFLRKKGRLTGLTEFGENVYALSKRMLHDAKSMVDMGADWANQKSGRLCIGATHLLARYAVLGAVKSFATSYPDVDVEITQLNPPSIVEYVAKGLVQFGVSTLPREVPEEVQAFAACKIERWVITPLGHPLTKLKKLHLNDLAKYPIVGDRDFAWGRGVQEQFRREGIEPKAALKSSSSDLVKAAVTAGLGIAIVQRVDLDRKVDDGLAMMDARHLFPTSQAYIVLRRGEYLRRFAYDCIARIAPRWTEKAIRNSAAAV